MRKLETKEDFLNFMDSIAYSRSYFGKFVYETEYSVCRYIYNYMYSGIEYIVLGNGFKDFKTEVEAGIYIGKNVNAWCALKVTRTNNGVFVSRIW